MDCVIDRKQNILIECLPALIWVALVLGGFTLLNWYKAQPGPIGMIHTKWPGQSVQPPDRYRYSLMIFLHPKCQCTVATLTQLAEILRENPKKFSAYIYFFHPEKTEKQWAYTDLWNQAAQMPDAQVFSDQGGYMARQFGAETSGQAFVYNPDGDLMFSGGITESRGHIGPNPGQREIASIVASRLPSTQFTKAFGCGLFSENERLKYNLNPLKQED